MIGIVAAIGILALLSFILFAGLLMLAWHRKRDRKEFEQLLAHVNPMLRQVGLDGQDQPVSLDNLRQHYREAPEDAGKLSVAIAGPEEEAYPVRVVDATIFGMGVFLEKDANRSYSPGESAYLYITTPQLEDTIVTPAIVCHQTNVIGGSLYGFKFADLFGMTQQLPAELQATFNKRRERRFVPDPECPVVVTIQAVDESFKIKAYLRNLSASGLSFIVSPSEKRRLSTVNDVDLSFCLSENSEPLQFRAGLRPPAPLGKDFNYGVFFDKDRTDLYPKKRETIEKIIGEIDLAEGSTVAI